MGTIIEKIKEESDIYFLLSDDKKELLIEEPISVVAYSLLKPEVVQLIAELTEIVNQMEE